MAVTDSTTALPPSAAAGVTRIRRRPRRLRESLTAYGLIAPAAFFYAAFQLLPILGAFALSLFRWNGITLSDAQWVGLQNYDRLIHDPLFWRSLEHNALVAVAVLVIQCGGSFVVAAIIHAGIRCHSFLRVLFFAPVVVSSVAVGMLAIFFFSPSIGLLNQSLGAIGLGSLQQPWLGSSRWALPSVAITYMLQNFGLSMLLFLSALKQVDPHLLEAAEIDGASQGAILWRIVFPIIRPVASVVFLLGMISAFRLFETVYVMTSGGPFHASDTLVTYLYSVSFGGNDIGYGNAIGVALFLIIFTLAVIHLRVTRAGEANE
jgi:ABC-type sugar transport system permease subunit